jgi:fibronectin type III domain protein
VHRLPAKHRCGLVVLVALALGCGGTSRAPTPSAPSGLVATAGNGQVALSWSAAGTGARFRVYYRPQPGVTKANGTRVDDIATSSTLVTGLTNDTSYAFVVTAFNSSGESAESNEVVAMPVPPGDFTQASLAGTWRFQAIAAGASPGWMRGTATVAADGSVTVTPFLDSTGGTTAPAGLFPKLLVDPAGQVRDADNIADAAFTGVVGATNRNKIVGTSSRGGTQLLVIMLKHDPAVSFDPAAPGDLAGFGGTLGGARRFAYSQIATGSAPQEWEFAQGQIGANNPAGGVQYRFSVANVAQNYPFLSASNAVTRPGDKASILSFATADGEVTEALNTLTATSAPQAPPPRLVMGTGAGIMSDDKATIVATATDGAGASPRYVLRIYQLINIGPLNAGGQDTAGGQPLTFALTDLAGEYRFRELAVSDAGAPLAASGALTVDATSGAVAYASYADTSGGAAPSGFALKLDEVAQPPAKQNGILTSGDDASLHGKLGDFKDLLVLTRTTGGASRLTIAVK